MNSWIILVLLLGFYVFVNKFIDKAYLRRNQRLADAQRELKLVENMKMHDFKDVIRFARVKEITRQENLFGRQPFLHLILFLGYVMIVTALFDDWVIAMFVFPVVIGIVYIWFSPLVKVKGEQQNLKLYLRPLKVWVTTFLLFGIVYLYERNPPYLFGIKIHFIFILIAYLIGQFLFNYLKERTLRRIKA